MAQVIKICALVNRRMDETDEWMDAGQYWLKLKAELKLGVKCIFVCMCVSDFGT